ncbi:MAG: endonuclease III domain-containing protein [Nanoarchaeota archaeon]
MNKFFVIYEKLFRTYRPQGWWPILSLAGKKGFDADGYHKGSYDYPWNEQQRFEIILGAILTQNTSWKNVEKSLKVLQEKDLLSAENMEALSERKLASLIKSSGYFNQKAKKIKAMIAFLKSKKPITRDNLLSIWGVGPETADSILLYAYHKPVFVIDAYTRRIFSRIGLCKADVRYEELQQMFHKDLEKNVELFNEYHALIVEHAKAHCRTKPDCEKCPLLSLCKYGRRLKPDLD